MPRFLLGTLLLALWAAIPVSTARGQEIQSPAGILSPGRESLGSNLREFEPVVSNQELPWRIDCQCETLLPADGPLDDVAQPGTGLNLGASWEIGPLVSIGTWCSYSSFAGNGEVQLNQPGGQDFEVSKVDFIMFDFGPSILLWQGDEGPSGGSPYVRIGGYTGIGVANANVKVVSFDPTKRQLPIDPNRDPKEEDFVWGLGARLEGGLELRNGLRIGGFVGYGANRTGAITGRREWDQTIRFGVQFEYMLGASRSSLEPISGGTTTFIINPMSEGSPTFD